MANFVGCSIWDKMTGTMNYEVTSYNWTGKRHFCSECSILRAQFIFKITFLKVCFRHNKQNYLKKVHKIESLE